MRIDEGVFLAFRGRLVPAPDERREVGLARLVEDLKLRQRVRLAQERLAEKIHRAPQRRHVALLRQVELELEVLDGGQIPDDLPHELRRQVAVAAVRLLRVAGVVV